jgi:hypothetical protein
MNDFVHATPDTVQYNRAFVVTVASPVSVTALPHASIVAGHAARAAEARKHLQNDESCARAGIRFLPVAVETFGGWGPAATAFLLALASRVSDRSGQRRVYCRAALFQELIVCLLRGNAHILVRRSPLPPRVVIGIDTPSHATFNSFLV